jgi:hypothetical protein
MSIDLSKVLEILVRSAQHINRFVKEIAYQMINVIFEAARENPSDKYKEIYQATVPLISIGLTDTWPQVRLAASICARTFY